MNTIQSYLQEAKRNEKAFRSILDKYKVPHKELSVEEIYKKYSDGDRYGRWTITNFYEKEEGVFVFSNENIANLSGSGRTDFYKINNGKAIWLKNESLWMS
jgi:hypothetical protein